MNERLALIRNADIGSLTNVDWLEHSLLPALGLNPEAITSYPERLHAYFGGVRSWQFPNQLAPYLADLAGRGIQSYLEIGTRHGGTFMITVEYLKRFNPVVKAVAVDPYRSPELAEYIMADALTCHYLNVDSRSYAAWRQIERLGPYDLAFIDGDHSPEGFMNDWNIARENARIVAYHDADNDGYPWIRDFWKEQGHVGFLEFYPEIPRRNGGIGVAYDSVRL